ncbi:MAG: ClpP family protease [Actinomycetes bacterium]
MPERPDHPWPYEVPPPGWPSPPSPSPEPQRPASAPPMVTPDPRRWPDVLAERLHGERLVLLSGRLDDETAQRAAAEVMLLDAESTGPVRVMLSCPDADLDAALVLAETVALATTPVEVVARGAVGGPAVAVLAAGTRRIADPHAMLWLREPRASAEGRADELATAAEQHARQLGHLHELLAEATGRDIDEVASDLRAGRTLDAEAALAYGLVHEVVGRAPR